MFKRILKSAALLLSASVILAACGGMNDAQAQTVDGLIKSQDGKTVLNVKATQSITGTSGGIAFMFGQRNELQTALADGTGAIYQTLIVQPWFLSQFVRVGATNRWVNTAKLVSFKCAGNVTSLLWDQATNAGDSLNDNCATFYAVQAKAN